jgi:hypothetical protein
MRSSFSVDLVLRDGWTPASPATRTVRNLLGGACVVVFEVAGVMILLSGFRGWLLGFEFVSLTLLAALVLIWGRRPASRTIRSLAP